MADNKLVIDLNTLVRDAFYAIPDFTDENGRHLGGVYGALFKVVSQLKSGGFEIIEISTAGEVNPAFVADQIQHFTEIWKEVLQEPRIQAPAPGLQKHQDHQEPLSKSP